MNATPANCPGSDFSRSRMNSGCVSFRVDFSMPCGVNWLPGSDWLGPPSGLCRLFDLTWIET